MSSDNVRVGIFVATMTGLAEMCGEEVEDALTSAGFHCERLLMDGLGTDAFDEDYHWVLKHLDRNSKSLLDVGCGNGFWLDHIAQKPDFSKFELFGLDISHASDLGPNQSYICGEIETLPFEDKSFDVVTCFYVLEHIKNLNQAINELKRVTRRQLFLAVPCQRYNKYTFDLHVHFFYSPAYFQSIVGINNYFSCS